MDSLVTDKWSRHFGWADYLLFALTLLVPVIIGAYHAWKGSAGSTSQFLLGGKAMGLFPISMSLAAGAVSSNAMLGIPTDIYFTGTMFWWIVIAVGIGCSVATIFYLPVFAELEIVSVSQYLELRYSPTVRRMTSFISVTKMIFFSSIVAYGPSLALSQVTGFNGYLSCGVTFVICIFYTAIGGVKAVVWTDTIQIFLMVGSVAVLIIKATVDIGIGNVWQRNVNSSRIEFFNVDPDPTTEKTVWSMVIGGGFMWASAYGVSQESFQRYISLPTRQQAQVAMVINYGVVGLFLTLCCASGVVAYAKYFECDPLLAKVISKADQIIPYFAMDVLGDVPGLPGLFVAGVFGASLSTLSTVLNALGLIILEDFVRPFYPNLSDLKATRISKTISVTCGLVCFGLVFVISNVKTILDAMLSLSGASLGAGFGVFTLGLLVPWSNAIGAAIGLAVSWASVIALGMATQMAKSTGRLVNKQAKPLHVENCIDWNSTVTARINIHQEEPFVLLKISFMWYTLIGLLIVLVTGAIVSLVSGPTDPDLLDPNLLFHFIRRRVGQKQKETTVEIWSTSRQTQTEISGRSVSLTNDQVGYGLAH